MRLRVTVATGKVGSRTTDYIDIAEDELDDMTPDEREKYLNDLAQEKLYDMIDWDWEETL